MYLLSRPVQMKATALVSALVTVTALITACGNGTRDAAPSTESDTGRPASSGTTGAAMPASPSVEIPRTPVGEQLRWFLGATARLPIPATELSAHASAAFVEQVPAVRFNALFATIPRVRLEELTDVRPTALRGIVTSGDRKFTIYISVDGQEKIEGLLLSPAGGPSVSAAPAPASWSELDSRLRKVAPDVGFLAAEVTGSSCRTVHTVSAGTPRPLGSIFKLYVLGAVAERIRDGGLTWDTTLTITPELKSTFGGQLQDRPDNSKVTVAEAAQLMIAISDNTAADLLIHTVGRAAVEDQARRWSGHAALNVPFLTTREMFQLKGIDYPRQAEKYLSLGTERRRRFLDETVAKASLSGIELWGAPRDIGTLEWFGSPTDVCRTLAGLAETADPRVGQVMSVNDGGLGLDHKTWPAVWFKGGSEPGVLALSFLARSANGRTYVVTALTSNPRALLDESTATLELLALVRGAFGLLE
ncbi:serine hydrolase [Streptosporangiaceae bacterium NEAU-GS5]|nr:serine hydrolase [Streptosporangiaceae bacterium NEAU-GS5]